MFSSKNKTKNRPLNKASQANHYSRWRILGGFTIFLLLAMILLGRDADATSSASLTSGFAETSSDGVYRFNLLSALLLPDAIEISPNQTIQVVVDTKSYFQAKRVNEASFALYLAMDRANIIIRNEANGEERQVTDTLSALQEIIYSTTEEMMSFSIKNVGIRSAVFDLSIRPR